MHIAARERERERKKRVMEKVSMCTTLQEEAA